MYRWVDHTAELELVIVAPTREVVFAEALRAFAELVDRGDRRGPARHELELEAGDEATLLAVWLDEFVYLADTDDFVPVRIEELVLSDTNLQATVAGVRASPAPLVKAVTYHDLELREADDGWHARVVLDV